MSVTHPAGLPGRRRRRRPQVHRRQGRRPRRQRRARRYAAAGVFTANRVQGQPGAVEPAGRQGRRRPARSSSTPAAPTATPAPRASRPPTPSPSGSPSGLGIGAIDVVVCSTGLIGLRQPDATQLLAGVDAAHAALAARRRRRRRRGDHDHRLGQQAGRRRGRRLVDRRDGQGRRHARARSWPPCSSSSPPTPSCPPPTSTPRCAPPPGSASTGSTPTAACPPTTPCRAGQRRQRASRPTPPDFTEALTQACTDLAHAAARATPRAPTTRSPSPCSTPRPRTTPSRSAAASPAATCSRPPSSATTPTGAGCWPRIGTTQAAFDPADLDVAMNGVWVCRDGRRRPRTAATVDLQPPRGQRHHRPQGRRPSAATVWTNDLTARLRPREQRVLLMTDDRTTSTPPPTPPRPPPSPRRCPG